jgi:hypothetical protein
LVDVVCVNWGTRYGREYTHHLFSMVRRNTARSFRFYCLTDRPTTYGGDITPIALPAGLTGWWNKMQLFRPGVLPAGEYLYFDLDVVIVDNIDCLLDFAGFGIARDFINPDTGILGGKEYNSSVMKFRPNEYVWYAFEDNRSQWDAIQAKAPFFGDQNVISHYLNTKGYSHPFPDDWIWSFKMGTQRGRRPVEHDKFYGAAIPPGGKVCVFHGFPKPADVDVDWVRQNWK